MSLQKKVSDLEQSHSHFVPPYIVLIDACLDVSPQLWVLRGKNNLIFPGPQHSDKLGMQWPQ